MRMHANNAAAFLAMQMHANDAIAFFAMHKKEKENEIEKENEKESEKENEKEKESSSQAAEENSDVSEFGSAAWQKYFIEFRSEIVIGKK